MQITRNALRRHVTHYNIRVVAAVGTVCILCSLVVLVRLSSRLEPSKIQVVGSVAPPLPNSKSRYSASGHINHRNVRLRPVVSEQAQTESQPQRYLPTTYRFAVNYPLPVRLPIVVVGMPKAGTSSIFGFLAWNGIISQHWYCCSQQYSTKEQKQIDFKPEGAQPKHKSFRLMSECMLSYLSSQRGQEDGTRSAAQDHKRDRNAHAGDDDDDNHQLHSTHHKSIFEYCGNYDAFTEMNGPRPYIEDPKTHRHGTQLDDGTIDTQSPVQRLFLPQHFQLEELHRQSPDSMWILNTRPVNQWIHSILKWDGGQYSLAKQIMNEFAVQYPDRYPIVAGGHVDADDEPNLEQWKGILKRIYEHHNEHVRSFVQQHNRQHAFLEIDITSSNAGEILSNTFGLSSEYWHQLNPTDRSKYVVQQ